MKFLDDIVTGVDGVELRTGNPHTAVKSIHHDSRTVDDQSLFVALAGESFDGHDFVDDAIRAGASAILVDAGRTCDVDVPVLEAPDTRSVLGALGSHFYGYPSREMAVIGVTGTNGKTSSSYLLESIFCAHGCSVGLIGTIEYRWGDECIEANNTTPDGLVLQRTLRAMADDGVQVVIIEVSSHGLELGRVDGTDFDAAMFTNLSRDHVDFHGSLQAYRQAKWRLFNDLLPAGDGGIRNTPVAVINTEEEEGRKLARTLCDRSDIEVMTHATQHGVVPRAEGHFGVRKLELTLAGVTMVVSEPNGSVQPYFAPLPGRFNAENILGAVATARSFGIAPDDVATGLEQCRGIPGRMQRVTAGRAGPEVFVDYAHTPDALRQSLQTLQDLSSTPVWVVFGCGGDRDRSKRAPMGAVAVRQADHIVVTSDNPRSEDPDQIIDEVMRGVIDADEGDGSWQRQIDRKTAIVDVILRAPAEDVILIAGKGHETYQERDGRRVDFDDRAVALDALRRRGEK